MPFLKEALEVPQAEQDPGCVGARVATNELEEEGAAVEAVIAVGREVEVETPHPFDLFLKLRIDPCEPIMAVGLLFRFCTGVDPPPQTRVRFEHFVLHHYNRAPPGIEIDQIYTEQLLKRLFVGLF
jgi:hypothetical protein